tara:strand:+ start:117 stop:350 length:234 start_codon:yes stop_codon:yes gene_type:complete
MALKCYRRERKDGSKYTTCEDKKQHKKAKAPAKAKAKAEPKPKAKPKAKAPPMRRKAQATITTLNLDAYGNPIEELD